MSVWYEVEKSVNGMRDFMECNWRFHDFKIQSAVYDPEKRNAELFLKYDMNKGSVFLRFIGVHSMRLSVEAEYGYQTEIEESVLFLQNGRFLWVDGTDCPEEIEFVIDNIKKYNSFVETERIVWAVCDETGTPAEMPLEKIDQVWNIYGKTEYHHFNLTPCDDLQYNIRS